jgi:hypothetical protein
MACGLVPASRRLFIHFPTVFPAACQRGERERERERERKRERERRKGGVMQFCGRCRLGVTPDYDSMIERNTQLGKYGRSQVLCALSDAC